MKKILLAPVILATSQIAMGGTGTDNLENLAGVENYGQIHIRGEQTITSAKGQWLDNYGTITIHRGEDGFLNLNVTADNNGNDANSGIKIHTAQEFVGLTHMLPSKLIENKDNPAIKNYYDMLSNMSYYSLNAEGGKLIIDKGANQLTELNEASDLDTYTNSENTDDYCIKIADQKSAIVFENVENESGAMSAFLGKEGNNVANNALILRGDTERDVLLKNNDENSLVINAGIGNNGEYLGEFKSRQDKSTSRTLSNAQSLNIEGNFNFKAFNGLFNEGKVSFNSGKSSILSVGSMFHSDIDVNNAAELELDPKCEAYNGDTMLNENNKTITYNNTMNVATDGKLTVKGGKFIIGAGGVLNLGAASGGSNNH